MARKVVEIGDRIVNREKALKMSRGFEPLHDPLASPCWQM